MAIPGDTSTPTGQTIIARLERLEVWSLSYTFIAIIGLGFLFTFYDIFDINVSFIQTCIALDPQCTPETALGQLPFPVVLNLLGYVVGTLVLSPIADKIGRRNMLLITMLITGLGSLYNAFAGDFVNFNIARIITGIGIGADLAIVNSYINEVAPRRARAKFTTIIFIMSALGAVFGIWLGLLLTTPATPWPLGLPFAQATPDFENGWRWMYGVGAVLAVIAIVLRLNSRNHLVGSSDRAGSTTRISWSGRWSAAPNDMDRSRNRCPGARRRTSSHPRRCPIVICSPIRCIGDASCSCSACGSLATSRCTPTHRDSRAF